MQKVDNQKVLAYAIAVLIVLCMSIMPNMIQPFSAYKDIWKYILMLLCVVSILIRKDVSESSIKLGIAVFVLLALYIAISRGDTKSFVTSVMGPLVIMSIYCAELTCNKEIQYLLNAFSNIIIALSVISIVCWIFGTLLHIMPGRIQTSYYWSSKTMPTFTYGYLYYENPVQYNEIFGMEIRRNTGFCPEAPGFTSFLSAALLIELFSKEQIHKGKALILAFALFSTFSTKSWFMILLLIVLLYWVHMDQKSRFGKKDSYILAAGLLIVFGILGVVIMIDKASSGSFAMRIEDIRATYLAWKTHPIFGIGFRNTQDIIYHFKVTRTNKGLSMGVLVILAQGGIYLLSLYLTAFLVPLKKIKNTMAKKKYLSAAAIFILELIISNVGYGILFLSVIAIALGFGVSNTKSETQESGVEREMIYERS